MTAQGPLRETGQLVLRPTEDFKIQVVSARAEFTIRSATGDVTGTKTLVSHVAGDAGATVCGDSQTQTGLHLENPAQLAYTATITTPEGVFTDRGSSRMDFEDTSVGFPTEFSRLEAQDLPDRAAAGRV